MSKSLRHSSVVVLLALLGAGCVFAVETQPKKAKAPEMVAVAEPAAEALPQAQGGSAPAAVAASSAPAKQEAKPSAKAAARKAEKQAREVTYARMELALAEMDAQNNLIDANFELQQARTEESVARRNLEHFRNVTAKLELEDAQMDLDRTTQSAMEQEQEYGELEAMYKEEEVAAMTKELVLARGKNRLLMARRQLELLEKRIADKREHELKEKEHELTVALEKAVRGVASAEAKLKKVQGQNELELLRARHKVEDAQRGDDEDEEDGEKAAAEGKGS